MKNIDKINDFIKEIKDEDIEGGSVLIITVKPVEKIGDSGRSMMNCVVNALSQGIASAILEDADIRKLIADAGMLATMKHIEREQFVDNILKKIKQ